MSETQNYEELKNQTHDYYQSLQTVFCPALNQTISFSSFGFNHIVYKRQRNERERSSQMLRFKLLPRGYKLVGLTTTFQEFEHTVKEFSGMQYKEKMMQAKTEQYWGLIAIIEDRKIKVILRKVGNGNIHFWSIVPAWVTNKARDKKYIRTMKGDPDTD